MPIPTETVSFIAGFEHVQHHPRRVFQSEGADGRPAYAVEYLCPIARGWRVEFRLIDLKDAQRAADIYGVKITRPDRKGRRR